MALIDSIPSAKDMLKKLRKQQTVKQIAAQSTARDASDESEVKKEKTHLEVVQFANPEKVELIMAKVRDVIEDIEEKYKEKGTQIRVTDLQNAYELINDAHLNPTYTISNKDSYEITRYWNRIREIARKKEINPDTLIRSKKIEKTVTEPNVRFDSSEVLPEPTLDNETADVDPTFRGYPKSTEKPNGAAELLKKYAAWLGIRM